MTIEQVGAFQVSLSVDLRILRLVPCLQNLGTAVTGCGEQPRNRLLVAPTRVSLRPGLDLPHQTNWRHAAQTLNGEAFLHPVTIATCLRVRVIAIDAGTTGVRARSVHLDGRVPESEYQEFTQFSRARLG